MAALACALSFACGDSPPGSVDAGSPGSVAPELTAEPRNLLLVTVDTLRADHLSSYGYPRLTSPVIDGLAAEGVRFDQPSVQWPKTGPSFASMMTATYPKDNGIVRRVGIPLPAEFELVAERLQTLGYATYAVVSNGALGTEFHFDQGFDRYLESWRDAEDPTAEESNAADVVTAMAESLLPELDGARPFFLWVHYLDPHFPYQPPAEYRDLFMGDAWYDDTVRVPINPLVQVQRMEAIGRDQVLDGSDRLADYIALYDAEIRFADDQIGRLLESLRSRSLLDNTVTIVSADHGESLSEHEYYFDHGRFGFETCLRVPLIVHAPGLLAPRVDGEPAELIDLAPTLLELAGVELPDGRWKQGQSLVPRLLGTHGSDGEPVYSFSEAGYATNKRWQKVARDRRFKLLYAPFSSDQSWIAGRKRHFALYDLENDPFEQHNVLADHPAELKRLEKAMQAWWTSDEGFSVAPASSEQGEMSEETRRQLEALGYLQ